GATATTARPRRRATPVRRSRRRPQAAPGCRSPEPRPRRGRPRSGARPSVGAAPWPCSRPFARLAEVAEARELGLEVQVEIAGRTVAVLGELEAHDRLLAVLAVLLPEEHDEVRVSLQCAAVVNHDALREEVACAGYAEVVHLLSTVGNDRPD